MSAAAPSRAKILTQIATYQALAMTANTVEQYLIEFEALREHGLTSYKARVTS